MGRTIDWARQARTDLRRLPKREAERVRLPVQRLAVSGHGDVEHLKGFAPPLYRLRVGTWRVTFRYEEAGMEEEGLAIERVLHRREAYRKSGSARQGVPDMEGFDESEDWEMQERSSI